MLRVRPIRRLLLAGILLAASPAATAQVVINELMYHAASGFDGDDFIELRNLGTSSVDLTGWCVDGVDFCFPAGASIAASDYLVLAQDSARFTTTYGFAPDHVYAGSLANGGERLALLDAASQIVDDVTYLDLPPWPVTPDGLGPSLEVVDPLADNSIPRDWRACTATAKHTARAPNSVNAVGLPPWIENVSRTPSIVPSSTPMTVTAKVTDGTTVQLIFKIGFGSETIVPMNDDGLSGDGAAGDGVYGASIPGQLGNTMVRYRITVSGPTGLMNYPRTDDTVVYDGTYVLGSPISTELPVLHWLMDPVDYADALHHRGTDETEPCVLFYNGVLYDSVQTRIRGQSSRSWAKPSWKFLLPQGHDFFAPGLIEAPVDNFDLQSGYSDKTYQREILSWGTFRDAGSPWSQMFHFRVQRNGSFQGLYMFMEDPDAEWAARNGIDPEGARYKAFDDLRNVATMAILMSRYEKQTRLWEDYSDLFSLVQNINLLTGQALKNYLFDNIDIPATINYLAAGLLIHNNDSMKKNYFVYRDTNGTGRWSLHPWDLDLTFGRNAVDGTLNDLIWADVDVVSGKPLASPSHPLFGDDQHQKYDLLWNRLIDRLYDDSDIRAMYMRRVRTLMDQLLISGHYEPIMDGLVPTIQAEADLDASTWGQYGDTQGLTEAVDILKNQYLAVRRTHLFTTHRIEGEIPAAQSISPRVVINEIMYNPAGGSEDEYVELYNPSATEAIDLSGWRVDGLGLTIRPGTVILPNGYALLVKNDVQFRATYGAGKFIGGQYVASLADAGETLTLRDRNGLFVTAVAYTSSTPWPSGPNGSGSSLELVDAAQANGWVANWAASTATGGTPGAANSTAGTRPPFPGLFINEILPSNTTINTDEVGDADPWVEIFNASPSSVDLGGMYLSNSFAAPQQWTIPTGTSLCPGCWLLIWTDGEPLEGPLHSTFALNPSGGDVLLTSSSGLLLDYLTYGTLGTNTSFGRFPDGSQERRAFAKVTPSAANDAAPVTMILNEYNAVDPLVFLKSGASDTYWGRVPGNGGDWFELVVTQDHLDIRNWQLRVTDDTGGENEMTQMLVFSGDALWSDLRSGTLITVSEELPDDVSYDPEGDDWWINVQANFNGSGTYVTNQDFTVSNSAWQLAIRDALGNTLFGPAGEGVNPVSGVGNDEVFKLEANPTPFTTSLSNYKDGTSSTFGSPNLWSAGTLVQDFSALRCEGFDCSTLDGTCSLGACDGALGQCVARANGSCGITGTVRYYRDSVAAGEPSAKPVPGSPVDATQDLLPEATSTTSGSYDLGAYTGAVQVRTLGRYGSPRAADHNGAITSFDASLIAQHAVQLLTLSANQQIAGDVSGNGGVTAFDASQVAQFAVGLIDHFDVATSTGSDWKYLRCDTYQSATDQTCGLPVFTHSPMTEPVQDDFYGILYGDVTGNWVAAAAQPPGARSDTLEDRSSAMDRTLASSAGRARRLEIPRMRGSLPAVLHVRSDPGPFHAGQRYVVLLQLSRPEGIQALDLQLGYDPQSIAIVDARTVGEGSQLSLVTNDLSGRYLAGLYGAAALSTGGPVLQVTFEALRDLGRVNPIAVTGNANEGRIRLVVSTGEKIGTLIRDPGRP